MDPIFGRGLRDEHRSKDLDHYASQHPLHYPTLNVVCGRASIRLDLLLTWLERLEPEGVRNDPILDLFGTHFRGRGPPNRLVVVQSCLVSGPGPLF